MRDGIPAGLAAAVELGGEMGARFGRYDWDAHPLGPPAGWPVELRNAAATALTSRFPIVLWFGPDLFLMYNDAYVPLLAEKHPAALGAPGREAWWDIWDQIGPMLAQVMETGRATWSDDLMLAVTAAGQLVERYFTFSYSPIMADDGRVSGVFAAVTETTERVLGERRLRLLSEVAARQREAYSVVGAVRAAADVCDGGHPDSPFLAVYRDLPGQPPDALAGATAGVEAAIPASAGPLLEAGVPAGDGRLLIGDIRKLMSARDDAAADGGEPVQALMIPLAGAGGGRLLLGLNARRPLDERYRAFCGLLADQVSSALAGADAYEAETRRADELAELDRAKTAFLANVSHEFRTPLTLMLGPLQDAIAAETEAMDAVTPDVAGSSNPANAARISNSVQRERLLTAQRSAERLLRLVNSLLEYARTEAGRADPQLAVTDVGALTEHIASAFTELCERAGIGLELSCRTATARVDPAMWETVILNLLSNAVKFTLAGSVTVAVAEHDGRVRVTVADTGAGIPADDLPRLFERFYRSRGTRARSAEGSGLGLALVRNLVELQGGTVAIESTVGVGTTVAVEVPAVRGAAGTSAPSENPVPSENPATSKNPLPPESPTPSETPEPGAAIPAFVTEASQWLDWSDARHGLAAVDDGADSPARQPAAGRPLILICDDNADMRRHLHRVCRAHWDTLLAPDGDTALALLREHRPDLVVTDVMMPALDGLGLVAAVRADPRLAGVPMIMLSARAGVEAAGEGLAAGADDYLPKPFDSADLVNRIAARLDAGRREHERRRRDQADVQLSAALARLGTDLGGANSAGELLAAVLALPTEPAAAAVALAVPVSQESVQITYAGTVPSEIRARYHTVAADAPNPVCEVIGTGRMLAVPDTGDLDERYGTVVADCRGFMRSAVFHPLHDAAGTVLGAVVLMWPEPRAFDPDQLAMIGRSGPILARSVERIRLAEEEHRISTDFQEQQLDLDRRTTAAVVAAAYQPGAESMRVGGDWYLTVPLAGPGRLAVSVGDVVGHGLTAATTMSRLRSAAAACAITDDSPRFVLDVLERYAGTFPGAAFATVAYASLDTAAGTVDYGCAGHPYPLIVAEDGTTTYLKDGRRPPLGVDARGRAAGRAPFPAGSLLLLYTDGLIERPGESLDEGFARLAHFAARLADEPADAVCARLLEQLAPPGGYRDDVALLAVRPVADTATRLVTAVPALATELPGLRAGIRAWLDRLDLDGRLAYDVLLGCDEAVSNAVEHGSRATAGSGATVSLEMFAGPASITASVTDGGSWSADSSASRRAQRGRGLTLIHGLSDHVAIVRGKHGTRITMRFPRTGSGRARTGRETTRPTGVSAP